jgi:hypothetical protein
VFTWVLKVLSKGGLILGSRIGVDASTMEANAALKTIVRRDTGESYRKMLLRMAKESGIDSPMDEELARMDRKRVGKTLSSKDWQSQVDPEAKITKMKDGRTHPRTSQSTRWTRTPAQSLRSRFMKRTRGPLDSAKDAGSRSGKPATGHPHTAMPG